MTANCLKAGFQYSGFYRENSGENLDTKYIADQACLTKSQTAATTTKPNQKRALTLCNKFLTVGGVLVVVKHLTQ